MRDDIRRPYIKIERRDNRPIRHDISSVSRPLRDYITAGVESSKQPKLPTSKRVTRVAYVLQFGKQALNFVVKQFKRIRINPKRVRAGALAYLLILSIILPFVPTEFASAATATIVADGDITRGWPTVVGCTATTHFDCVNESTPVTTDYVATGTAGSGGEIEEFTMGNVANVASATSVAVTVHAQSATNANGGTLDSLSINLRINGTLQSASTCTPGFNTWANCNTTFNGSYTQADIDSLQVHVTRNRLGGGSPSAQDDDVQIAAVYADVTYTPGVSFEQSSYRWFDNQDANTAITYANVLSDLEAHNITVTSDGGYAVVGRSNTFGVGVDQTLVKYGPAGVEEWTKSFGGTGFEQGDSVVQTSDGGYLTVGYTSSYGAGGDDFFIVRFNSSGAIQWAKTWGGSSTDRAEDIVITNDGGFVVVGDTSSYGTGGDIAMVKFNSSGVEQWSKTWGGAGNDGAASVIQTTDGNLIVAANTFSYGAGSGDGTLIKFNSSGVEQWSKTWGGINGDGFQDVIEMNNGDFVTAGYTGTYGVSGSFDMTLVRYNSSGIEQWSKTWGGTGYDMATTLTKTPDESLIVAGYSNGYGSGGWDNVLIKYNSSGIEQWSKTWGGTGDEGPNWTAIALATDGGFAVTSYTDSFASGGQKLVKYNSSGIVANCSSSICRDQSITEVDLLITEADVTVTEVDRALTEGNVTISETDRTSSTTETVITAVSPSVDVGNTLAALSTPATAAGEGTPFRLRMNLHASIGNAEPGGASFKLQYAQRGADNLCDTSFTNESYSDLSTTNGVIRYANNTNAVDGQPLATNANDPTHSGHTVTPQRYEETNNFGISTTIPVNNDGMWDFALMDYNAPANTAYCFRVVYSTGGLLNTYSVIPQITTGLASFDQGNHRFYQDSTFTGANWDAKSTPWKGRHYHTVVNFDGKMWVMGGWSGEYRNDVWYSTDGNSWTRATANAAWSARYGQESLVFNNKMWVMGGYNGTTYLNDVWSSTDGVTWVQETAAASWVGRYDYAAVVHSNKMWVMGGASPSDRNDVWSSTDGVNWVQETAAAAWAARCCLAAVSFDNKIWVIGGGSYSDDVYYSTNGITWTLATTNPGWSARDSLTSLVYDNKIWVTGGFDGGRKNDVWYSANGITWTQATPAAGWSARDRHASIVYDNRMWVIGGIDGTNNNDAWSSTDGVSWTRISTLNATWSARQVHSSLSYDNKLWVIGGFDGGHKNDVWYSTDNGENWTLATNTAAFGIRSGHTSVVFNNQMWVIGGTNGTNDLNSVYYSSDGITWTLATASAAWAARQHHASVVFNNKMWVMGGITSGGPNDDVYSSTDGVTWVLENGTPGWGNRNRHSLTVHNNRMWIMGGHNGSTFLNNVWSSADGITWNQATASAAWGARETHRTITYDGKMWTLGGWNGSIRYNDVWHSTDGITWTQATANAAWTARDAFSIIIHNNSIVIIGGVDGGYTKDVWYAGTASTPGTPLALQNTPATLEAPSQKFRLRMLVPVSAKEIAKSGQQLKLQFAPKNGTCDTAFSGEIYQDVTTTSNIAFSASTTSASGDRIKADANDPTYGSIIKHQSYWLSNPSNNSGSYIPKGQAGMWEFALTSSKSAAQTSYCLRIVRNDNTPLTSYTAIPEIFIAPSTAQVMRHGRFFTTSGVAQPFIW